MLGLHVLAVCVASSVAVRQNLHTQKQLASGHPLHVLLWQVQPAPPREVGRLVSAAANAGLALG